MTSAACLPTIYGGSKAETAVATRLLRPLLRGHTIALSIDDPKLRKKKRVINPVLIISPFRGLGLPGEALLCSMPGYGSEVVETKSPIDFLVFYRMGIRPTMAKALANELNKLFSGESK